MHFEDNDSSDDEVDVALTYLVKAMKKKKNMKYGKHSKEKYVPRCYECNEKGHLRSDCPKLEKEKGKDGEDPNRGKGKYKRSLKRGMIVKNSWGMSDADSVYSDEPSSSDTEMKGIVFMAIKEPQVSLASSSKVNVISNEKLKVMKMMVNFILKIKCLIMLKMLLIVL